MNEECNNVDLIKTMPKELDKIQARLGTLLTHTDTYCFHNALQVAQTIPFQPLGFAK